MAFVGFAFSLGAIETIYGRIMLIGLVLCALGDILLIKRKDSFFLAGMGAFAAGHLAYAIAFSFQAPAFKTAAMVSAIAMVIISAAVLRLLWRDLGKMKVPVIGYMLIISVMVVMSVAATPPNNGVGTGLAGGVDARLIAGALGFAISDIAVARDQFVRQRFFNKAWGLPLYYISQMLLASSV